MKLYAAFAVAFALAAPRAGAEPAKEEAKRHRETARAAFAAGRFDEALYEYNNAYRLSNNADLLFNIGLCQESLHRNQEAIDSYTRFLAERPNSKDRGDVEVRIAAL